MLHNADIVVSQALNEGETENLMSMARKLGFRSVEDQGYCETDGTHAIVCRDNSTRMQETLQVEVTAILADSDKAFQILFY